MEERNCRDINECERDSPCEHICENTEGRSAVHFHEIQLEYLIFCYFFSNSLAFVASSASALMALSFPTMKKQRGALMSMNVEGELMSAVTNASMRKEVTDVHALKPCYFIAMPNDASIRIFVLSKMAAAVNCVNFIIIVRYARVEKVSKLTRKLIHGAMTLMNANMNISMFFAHYEVLKNILLKLIKN